MSSSRAPSNGSAVTLDVEHDVEKGAEENGTALPRDSPQPSAAPNDPNLVNWDGPDDPENPQNWPKSKKWLHTMLIASMTWIVTFASSVFSTGTIAVGAEFHISAEVATLGTSLFVLGFGLGPSIWGPLSELYGRMRPLFFAFFCFAVFQIPVAVAQNMETIMLCRFLGGVRQKTSADLLFPLSANIFQGFRSCATCHYRWYPRGYVGSS